MWSNVYDWAIVGLATIVPSPTAWSSGPRRSDADRSMTAASVATVNERPITDGDTQDVTGRVVEQLEAHRDGVLDVRRQRQRDPPGRVRRRAVEVVQPLLGDEQVGDRVDEQRVALGRPVHRLDDRAARRLTDDLLDELRDLGLRQAAQREHATVATHPA